MAKKTYAEPVHFEKTQGSGSRNFGCHIMVFTITEEYTPGPFGLLMGKKPETKCWKEYYYGQFGWQMLPDFHDVRLFSSPGSCGYEYLERQFDILKRRKKTLFNERASKQIQEWREKLDI